MELTTLIALLPLAVIVGSWIVAGLSLAWRFAGIRIRTTVRAWSLPGTAPRVVRTSTAVVRIVDAEHAYFERRFNPVGFYTPATLIAAVVWLPDGAQITIRFPLTSVVFLLGLPALVLTTSLANGEDIGAGLIMAGFTLVVFVAFVLPWVPLEYRRMLRMLDEYEESLDPARA